MGIAARALVCPLALVLLLGGAAPRDADLGDIAAAAGHPSKLHLIATRTVRRDQRTIEETIETDGDTRMLRACSADVCGGMLVKNGAVLTFGPNGVPLPDFRVDAAAERTVSAILSTRFAEPGFAARGGTVSRQPLGNGKIERWDVRAPEGSPLTVEVDAHSHRLLAIERPEHAPLVLVATQAVGTILYADSAYAGLERRAGPMGDPPGARTTVSDTRDVRLAPAALPIVDCAIDAHPARCLIDTGASPSAISLHFAELLDREPHGEIEIAALGDFLTGMIDTSNVSVGGARIAKLQLAVLPATRGGGFDAVLGSDALAALRLAFDPVRHFVRIGPSGPTPPPGTSIALKFAAGVPYVHAEFGAHHPETLLLDTGDVGMLSIGYDDYRRDLSLFPATGNTTALGIGGMAAAVTGEIPRATIGTLDFSNASIKAVRAQHGGHLGYAFAAACGGITLDFSLQSVTCARR